MSMAEDREPDGKFAAGNTVRATSLTPETAERILTSVRAGAILDTAAQYAGVPLSTFWDWVKVGRREDREPFASFVAELDQAVAENEMSNLAFISKARGEHWQAAAWSLERRYPERYGRRTRVDGNVTVTARPFIDTSKLSAEEIDTLAALLEKARPDIDDPALGADGRPARDLLQIEAATATDAEDADWSPVDEDPAP